MIYVYSGFGIILCPRFNVYPYWTSIHGGRDLGCHGYSLCAKEINSFSCVSCFTLFLKQIPVGRIYSQQYEGVLPQDAAQSQLPKESQNFRAPVGNGGGESISRSSTTVLRLHGSRDWARAAAERERETNTARCLKLQQERLMWRR